jgi:hypothetical protein
VLVRQNAPVIGASEESAYQAARTWQVGVSYRGLRSDDHYVGTTEQVARHELGTYVINRQNLLDASATYSLTSRASLSLSVPFVLASWSIPMPVSPVPGPRVQQDARGIGDVILTGRSWLLDPTPHRRGNVSFGLGIKAPTGASGVQDVYPDITGHNPATKVVDQSIQPGDGGWGFTVDTQAFRRVGGVVAFAGGTYLVNPRNTNGQPSIIRGLGVATTPATANRLSNSVPDQYLARVGVAMPAGVKGLSAGVNLRIEGQARYDLIGRSDGFRRPGTEMFVEPGLVLSRGRSTWSASVPIAFYRNRHPDPYTNARGDATFPDFVVLVGWSTRLGK